MALIMFPTFSLILKIRFKKCRERKLQIATMKKTADFSKDKPLFFYLIFYSAPPASQAHGREILAARPYSPHLILV